MAGQTREEILSKYKVMPSTPTTVSGAGGMGGTREAILDKYRGKESARPAGAEAPEFEANMQDRANAFGGGILLGFADELRAGLVTGMEYLANDDYDFGENYSALLDSYQDREAAYAEANPMENLALNVAGGLTSGGATLAKAIPAGLKIFPKFAAHTAVAAGEGALAGAGGARQGERLEGAEEGALWGVGGKVAGDIIQGGLGMLGREFSERRVAQELGEGKDFIPLPVAAPDSALAQGYESSVGRMWGSQIPEQTETLIERLRQPIGDAISEADAASKQATTAGARLQQRLKRGRNEAITSAGEVAEDETRALTQAIKAKAADAASAVESGSKSGAEVAKQNFRQMAVNSGMPPNIDPKMAEKLQGADPQEAVRSLSQAWKGAFQDVKSKTFDIDPTAVIDDALGEIDTAGLDDYSKSVLDTLNSKVRDKTALPKATKLDPLVYGASKGKAASPLGKISGEDLMEARNTFRVALNSMKDKGATAQQREAFRRVAKSLDSVIEDGLSGSEKALYKAERDAWGNYQTLRGATGRAAANKQGNFEPSDWISEKKLAQRRRVDEGTAPLQKEAMDTQRAVDAAKGNAKDEIAAVKSSASEAIEAATAKKRETMRGLTRAKALADDAAALRNVDKFTPDKMSLKGKAAREAEKAFAAAEPDIGNIFTQRATQSMIPIVGGAIAGPLGGAVGTGAAIGLGKGLTSQTAQRLLAGQTDAQKAIAEVLRRYDMSDADKIIKDLRGGLVRGTITGQGE